jgi:hypothetical protein
MPITGVQEGGRRGAQVVLYAPPEAVPKEVRWLRILLLVLGCVSLVNVLTSFPGLLRLQDDFREINEVLHDGQTVPRWSECRPGSDMAQPACPMPDRQPLEGEEDACFMSDGTMFCAGTWPDVVLLYAGFGDSAQIAVNAMGLMTVMLTLLALYIPLRYFLLWRRARRADPRALDGILFLASLQMSAEALRIYIVYGLLAGTQLIDATDFLAWLPVGILLAPVVIHLARKPAVREFFSAIEWRRVGPVPVGRMKASRASIAPVDAEATAAVAAGWIEVKASTRPGRPGKGKA